MTTTGFTEEQETLMHEVSHRIIFILDDIYPKPTQRDKASVAFILAKILATMVSDWPEYRRLEFIERWKQIMLKP
jgi:hypothetical protein